MNSWQKSASIWLITLLAVSSVASFFSGVTATTINPKYAGTKSIDRSLEIKFSKNNNSILYLDSDSRVDFSVGFGRYTFDYMSLGAFIYSVSVETSWQNSAVQVYNWSFNDPANLKDDDPNPKQSSQGTISLKDAPLGKQQITVTALAGAYVTDFSTYWIYTVKTTSTLNFTIANQPPVTPSPTFGDESGILWRTDIPWNLTGTPAQDLWDTEIGGLSRSWTKPIVVNEVVYAGATSSASLNRYGRPSLNWVNIYAFDGSSGKELWSYQAPFRSITDLAVSDGKVYFGSWGGGGYKDAVGNQLPEDSLIALDVSNGELLWKTSVPIFYSTPVAGNGKVFMNSGYSALALDSTNGNIIWNYTAKDALTSPPTLVNDVLYIRGRDANLYALRAENGEEIWSYRADGGFSSALVVNGIVFAPCSDGQIYSLNAASGAKLWSCDTTPPEFAWVNYTSYSTPFYSDGAIYFTSSSGQHIHNSEVNGPDNCKMSDKTSVFALDAASGRKLWNYTVNNGVLGYPVTVKNGVVYTQYGGSLVGFNAQSGALIWNYTKAELWPISQLAVTNSVLYIGFSDGQIYAIRAALEGIRGEDQITALIVENQSMTLLIVIVVAVALALTTLVLLYRRRKTT